MTYSTSYCHPTYGSFIDGSFKDKDCLRVQKYEGKFCNNGRFKDKCVTKFVRVSIDIMILESHSAPIS